MIELKHTRSYSRWSRHWRVSLITCMRTCMCDIMVISVQKYVCNLTMSLIYIVTYLISRYNITALLYMINQQKQDKSFILLNMSAASALSLYFDQTSIPHLIDSFLDLPPHVVPIIWSIFGKQISDVIYLCSGITSVCVSLRNICIQKYVLNAILLDVPTSVITWYQCNRRHQFKIMLTRAFCQLANSWFIVLCKLYLSAWCVFSLLLNGI